MRLRAGRRFWIATAAALAGGLVAGLAVVAAHEITFDTVVDGTSTTVGATGAIAGYVYVTSGPEEPKCIDRRRVRVMRSRHDHPDELVKSGRANDEGYWRIKFGDGLKRADYYMRIDRKLLSKPGSDAHRHVCDKDRSQKQEFHFTKP
jgi:hypothetical protein